MKQPNNTNRKPDSPNRPERATKPSRKSDDTVQINLTKYTRMPHEVHESLVALGREPAPGPRHRPRHRGQGDLRAMFVPRPLPDPGRGMPLLAPVRAILREPLLRPRADTGLSPTHAAFSPTARPTDPPSPGTCAPSAPPACVFRAIDATDSPFRRKRRIDCTWGMPAIILPGPFRWRYKHHPVKTMTRSACPA